MSGMSPISPRREGISACIQAASSLDALALERTGALVVARRATVTSGAIAEGMPAKAIYGQLHAVLASRIAIPWMEMFYTSLWNGIQCIPIYALVY